MSEGLSPVYSTSWKDLARKHSAWRKCLHEGATFHERNLRRAATVKRQQRKERAAATTNQRGRATSHSQHHIPMPTLPKSVWFQNLPLQPSEDPQERPHRRTIILDYK